MQSELKEQIGASLGIRISNNLKKYLGLPTMIDGKKRSIVNFKDRFSKRIENRNIRYLLLEGKEVFIKSILQVIPVYTMQFFLSPITLCHELEKIISKFWWRNSKMGKVIHWCDWKGLCMLKTQGGLGFRDLAKFNNALLSKKDWKLIMYLNCLFARVMKAKYYLNSEFSKASLGSHPSYTWRSIWSTRGLLEEGMGWRVRNGKSINIWNEAWLPGPKKGKLTGKNINMNFTTIVDLVNSKQSIWRLEVLEKLFDEDQTNRIGTILVVGFNIKDARVWRRENTGEFSTKSGHKWLIKQDTTSRDVTLPQTTQQNFYDRLWNLQLASKHILESNKQLYSYF